MPAKPASLVSLTFDGSLICHLETVVPALADREMLATFYVEPAAMLDEYPRWRQVCETGHEIGNGTLLGSALPDGSLPAWTVDMVADDLAEAIELIEELFPTQGACSVALPVGPAVCAGSTDYLAEISHGHPVVRSGLRGLNRADVETARLKTIPVAGMTGPQLVETVRLAIQEKAWAVLQIDAVGVGDPGIDAQSLLDFLAFLDMSRDLVQVTKVIEGASLYPRRTSPVLR